MVKIDIKLSSAFTKANLTEKEKRAVKAYLEGLQIKEIADGDQVSPSAIKQRLKNAETKYTKAFSSGNLLKESLLNGLHLTICPEDAKAISKITSLQRTVIEFIIDGFDLQNIAHKENVSESAIKKRIKSAKETLRTPQKTKWGLALTFAAANIINKGTLASKYSETLVVWAKNNL